MLGISKRKDKNNSKSKESSSEITTPIYSKPKIMLVDLPKELSESLKSEGFNVSAGTFGSPYKVEVSNNLTPLMERPNLPNISEQEIVFIDLTPPATLEEPNSEYTETEDEQFWVSCSSGIIDPRQIYMAISRKSFDRTLNHGGFFIIFAQPRIREEYTWGKPHRTLGILGEKKVTDNWSFLSVLNSSDLSIDHLSGEEIKVRDSDHVISKFLRKNSADSNFTAIFNARNRLEDKWVTLLKNKFGNPISGLIFAGDEGKILILPQLPKTHDVILALLNEVLPELAPHLFPHLEGAKWVERDEYELDAIKEFKNEKIKVQEEAENTLASLDEKIKKEREEFGFLHGILNKTGDELVEDVKKCLDFIGFKQVIDVDQNLEEGKKREEDLQIHDESPTLLVEIKGISGFPTDEDILQVHKYLPRRMQEWGRVDVGGITIINYRRNIPAFEREPFLEDQIKDVKSHNIAILSTVDLFVLIRGMIKWEWDSKVIRDLFYEIGKLPDIPSHYKPIGEIFTYIKGENIIGININSRKLYKGQKIGYKIDNEFLEEEITSLQVDNQDIEEALSGQVGIKTTYSEKELKNGTTVYDVIE